MLPEDREMLLTYFHSARSEFELEHVVYSISPGQGLSNIFMPTNRYTIGHNLIRLLWYDIQ